MKKIVVIAHAAAMGCAIAATFVASAPQLAAAGGGPSTTLAPLGCSETPRICLNRLTSVLMIKQSAAAAGDKDKLKWKFIKGSTAGDGSLFGDPTTTTTYSLCVYDDESLAAEATIPAGSAWTDLGGKGFQYLDKSCAADGICKVQLKAGTPEKPKQPSIKLVGKGAALPDPALPFSEPINVRVQAQASDISDCFNATYDPSSTIKSIDDGAERKLFKAKD